MSRKFCELYYQYNDKWENWCYSGYSWKVKRTQQVQKGKIMATVNFAADVRAYYLNSEHYETLYSKEKEQGLIKVRSCRVRKRRKTV